MDNLFPDLLMIDEAVSNIRRADWELQSAYKHLDEISGRFAQLPKKVTVA